MAGGSVQDLRAPYPKGEDSTVQLVIPCTIQASKTKDYVVCQWTAPFAFKAVSGYYTAQDFTETNAITLNIQDDSGTPNELLTDFPVPGSQTGGAGFQIDLTSSLDKSTQINAGAIVEFSYGSGAGDTSVDGVFVLNVKPVN